MNRFRVSSTDGTSSNISDNTVYYLSGSGTENKRPNIISRPKTKSSTIPTSVQASHLQQQQVVVTSSEEQGVPPDIAIVTSTAEDNVNIIETMDQTEGESPVCVPIQILDEAASAEFLRATNAGNHQIITDASGTMTYETDDGNVMVILQNDDDDDTTTGTIAFAHDMTGADHNAQIIQNAQFPTGDATIEIPNMEFGENDLPETTSYILVQMDDQGNNILVPASAFSSQVNGIPTLTHVPVRTTQHQNFTTQTVRTTQQQNFSTQSLVQERGKPFRYVLPESEEGVLKIEDGSQYILNVLPGPSQSQEIFATTTTNKLKKEAAPPKVKAPPKPRKPKPKKTDPVSTSTPVQGKSQGKVTVAIVSQLTSTTTSTAPLPSGQGAMPGTVVPQNHLTSTNAALPTSDSSLQATAVAVNLDSLKPTQILGDADADTQLMDIPEELSKIEQSEESTQAITGESVETGSSNAPTVSTALGIVVSGVQGPAIPVASTAVVAGPGNPGSVVLPRPLIATPGSSKQNIIVVGPKPSTSKDSSTNGAPKKPIEEIVVTAFGTFKCTFCFKESTVRSHLVNHINRIHKGEKPFKCKVCNIGFQYSSSLKVHEKNHTVEKPFKCDFCECAFATDSNRNLHQKTVHLVPKDSISMASTPKLKFECATCKKAYCSKYNLLCHRLTHVDDFTKPIVCDFCKKECKTKAMLVNHVQTHKDAIGPFSCNVCDMSFTSESRLAVHKVMHKDKKKIYVKVEPVVENRQPKLIRINVSQRRNMKVSTPTPRKKKEKVAVQKEVFCSLCDDIFPNAVALDLHKQKKHGPGSAARTYSKRDSDQYESYIGKQVAKKLEEKATTSRASKVIAKKETQPNSNKKAEKVQVKRRPGRPKKGERVLEGEHSSTSKKFVAKRDGKQGLQKKRGRPARKRQISLSSTDSENIKTPEKKRQVQVKEVSPKEKLSKPIKKRPIREDPVSEPNSSREPSPVADDLSIRKSQRKRSKNPYLEELKRKREKKAKQQKVRESLKGTSDDSEATPAKRKRLTMITAPKKEEKVTPSPKKDDDDVKPMIGSSRGGRKRKQTDVVIAAAIPKKRPFPKEIQELIAASETSSSAIVSGKDVSKGETGTKEPKNFEPPSSSKAEKVEDCSTLKDEMGVISKTNEPSSFGAEMNTEESEEIPLESLSEVEKKSNSGSAEVAEKGDLVEDSEVPSEQNPENPDDEKGVGPVKSTEDSGPPTSTSSDGQEQDDDKQGDEKVDTSVPMKKRKVIKPERERDKDVDKDEVGKSFFQIFKQVKKDYVSSM